jgi:hypothetical protein
MCAMQRVYWLLRHNQEIGPFTIDELMQQSIVATDLIWVDGAAHAWAYPKEIPEIAQRILASKETKPQPKNSDEIERKADQLRRQILAYRPVYFAKPKKEQPVEWREDTLLEQAKEQIEFTSHSYRKKPAYDYVVAALVTVTMAASLYGGRTLLFSKQAQVQSQTAIPIKVEKPVPLAEKKYEPVIATLDTARARTDSVASAAMVLTAPKPKHQGNRAAANVDTGNVVTDDSLTDVAQNNGVTLSSTSSEMAKKEETKEEPKAEVKENKKAEVNVNKEPVHKKESPDTTKAKKTEKTDGLEENKKTFGQMLKGLFKKKKKEAGND